MCIKPQTQEHQPGREDQMDPQPQDFMEHYKAAGKLEGKMAIITGGDSGIGQVLHPNGGSIVNG